MATYDDTVISLSGSEAIEKVKKLAEGAMQCMFTTNLSQVPLTTRPMATQEVDAEGNLWFMCENDTNKVREINQDNRVQLFYANLGESEYLSVYGTATVIYDQAKIEELWNPFLKTWFNNGPKDPNLRLIKVAADEGHYWDTKNNKLVQNIKITFGALTGKTFDDGREGDLSL